MALFNKQKNDEEILYALDELKKIPNLLGNKWKKYKKDQNFIIKAIENNADVYPYISEKLKKDIDFVSKMIKVNVGVLEFMGIKKGSIEDIGLAKFYLKMNPDCKDYISEKTLKNIAKTSLTPISQKKKTNTEQSKTTEKKESREITKQNKFDDFLKMWILPDSFTERFNEIIEEKIKNGQKGELIKDALNEVAQISAEGQLMSTEERTLINSKKKEFNELIQSNEVDINAKDDEGHSTAYSIMNYSWNPLMLYMLTKTKKLAVDDDVLKEIATIKNDDNKYIYLGLLEYKAQKDEEAEQLRKEEEAAKAERQRNLQHKLFEALKNEDIVSVIEALNSGATLNDPFLIDQLPEDFKKEVIDIARNLNYYTDDQSERI